MFPADYFDSERWHLKFVVFLELLCLGGMLLFLWSAIYHVRVVTLSLFLGCFSALYGALFVRMEQERQRVSAKRKSTT